MGISTLYPIINFTQVDYAKIPVGAFLIGFDSSNTDRLCKMDNSGTITVIEGGGGAGTFYEFYYQPNQPSPNPTTPGARWVDSDTNIEYIWVLVGDTYSWIQASIPAEFYFQPNPPVPNPTTLGARWIDSDNGVEYVWVFDGTNYFWVQPTQLGKITYQTLFINTATYSTTFAYEYYGVTYTGGICTITLPLGNSPDDDGQFINIADEVGGISYGNRGILVQGSGGQLINGETSVLMRIERMSLNFMFRNNSWKTI